MTKSQDFQKHREWVKRIENWRASGETVADWCSENGINQGLFYYWRKQLLQSKPQFQKEITPTTFIEIPEEPPSDAGIEIECHNLTVRVRRDFDPKTLQSCLQILRSL